MSCLLFRTAHVRHVIVVAVSAGLAACGGGGGAGPGSAGSGPLDGTKAEAAVTQAMAYPEAALVLGQVALDALQDLRRRQQIQFQAVCVPGANRTVELADLDGDGVPSSGDRVTVSFNDCQVPAAADRLTGAMQFSITSTDQHGGTSGTIEITRALVIRSDEGSVAISGSLGVTREASEAEHVTVVGTIGTGLTFGYSTAGKSEHDRVTSLHARRRVSRVSADVVNNFEMTVDSAVLGGVFTSHTTTPWVSWLDSFPHAGEQRVTGPAGDFAVLRARPQGLPWADLLLNGVTPVLNTDGGPDFVLRGAVMGYLWEGTDITADSLDRQQYLTTVSSETGFRILRSPAPTGWMPQPGTWSWQYSRPLANDVTLQASLVCTTFGCDGAPIPIRFDHQGAWISVTPLEQLIPGGQYRLDVVPTRGGSALGEVFDDAGRSAPAPWLAGMTEATVTASAALLNHGPFVAGYDAAQLHANALAGPGRSVSSIQWRTVSGPPLQFAEPNSVATTAAPIAGGGNGTSVAEVEVRDDLGNFVRSRTSLTTIASPFDIVVVSFRSPTTSERYVVADASNTSTYARWIAGTTFDSMAQGRVFGRALLNGFSTGVPVAGNTYTLGASVSGALIYNTENLCAQSQGSVTFHEFTLDGSGQLANVAMDFTQRCGTQVTALGSIRLRSSLPPLP